MPIVFPNKLLIHYLPMNFKKYIFGSFSWQRIVRSSIIIYILVAITAYFYSEVIIFQPPEPRYNKESITFIKVNATEHIAAIYKINPKAQYTVLYSHGNAEDLAGLDIFIDYFYMIIEVMA